MESKTIIRLLSGRGVTITFGLIILLLVTFQAGIFFGSHRSRSFAATHGLSGTIVKIDLPRMIVANEDNMETVIVTDEHTFIRRHRESLSAADLRLNDRVIILGRPDDSAQLQARLIRITTP